MKLKQLEIFVAVADHKSFSKAAKVLYLTQPTVSAHISALEKELNVKLFARNTKEVSLTQDGEILFQYACQMVHLSNKIEEIFLPAQKEKKTHIFIAASTVPAQYLLPEILAEYKKKHPKVQFMIKETDSAGVVRQVAGHMSDIGFLGTMPEKRSCQCIAFYRDELVIVMPNQDRYRQIRETQSGLDWILEEPIIMREEGSGTRKEAERLLKKSGIDVSELNIAAAMENPETVKRAVKNGMGISVMSRLTVQEELESGGMIEFPVNVKSTRTINMIYNGENPLSKPAKDLIRLVKNYYSEKKG